MKKRSKARVALYWLIFIGMFTVVPLLLIEGAARVYAHYKYGKPGKSYGLWRYDPVLGAQHKEHAYNSNAETNDYGFRNAEDVIEPKPEGAWRIIAYGGSTTFCYNLFNEEAWPAQLEKQLRQHHHPQDQVLNGGAIMWSLGHAFARARKDLPALHPDYVIIYSGINEQPNAAFLELDGVKMKDLVERGEYGRFATNLDQNRWIKRNLMLVRILDYFVYPLLQKEKEESQIEKERRAQAMQTMSIEPDPYVLENYLQVLRRFITFIQEQGSTPVFVAQAHGRNNRLNIQLTAYSRRGMEVARQLGAIVVDANEMVEAYEGEPMDLFSHSGVHYSKKGAEMLGAWLYRRVFQPLHTHPQPEQPPAAAVPEG